RVFSTLAPGPPWLSRRKSFSSGVVEGLNPPTISPDESKKKGAASTAFGRAAPEHPILPVYMSPEGESDIGSLGVVVFGDFLLAAFFAGAFLAAFFAGAFLAAFFTATFLAGAFFAAFF